MEIGIRGAEQLGALAKALRAQGEAGKGLRQELYRGIQRATKPLKTDAKAATSRLPQRGGLAAEVGKVKMTTKTRGGGQNVGVSIVGTGKYVRSTDRGYIRRVKRVDPGWFTETMTGGAPGVRVVVVDSMSRTADAIRRST